MIDDIKQAFNDCNNDLLPMAIKFLDKIHCSLKIGKRVYWYYTEDLEFWNAEGINIKDVLNSIYSGILIPIPDSENRGDGEMDIEQCIIVMDQYPTEGEYPQATWFALKRLVDDYTLIEIFSGE